MTETGKAGAVLRWIIDKSTKLKFAGKLAVRQNKTGEQRSESTKHGSGQVQVQAGQNRLGMISKHTKII